jgi:hypothetical protein
VSNLKPFSRVVYAIAGQSVMALTVLVILTLGMWPAIGWAVASGVLLSLAGRRDDEAAAVNSGRTP